MKILGFYGMSDVGKTTLVEAISNKQTNKYSLERARGITLKVSYTQFEGPKDTYYVLDNPGHNSFSIETLRNIDLIDFALYIFDATIIKERTKQTLAWNHFCIFKKLFEKLGIPFCVLINKAQLVDPNNIKAFFEKNLSTTYCIPTCAKNVESLNAIKSLIYKHAIKKKRTPKQGIFFRTIKSFDVNKVGVPLKEITGGILGGYFYEEYDPKKEYFINEKNTPPSYTPLVIKKVLKRQIGSIQTSADANFFKNDRKKGTYVISKEFLERYPFLRARFRIKTDYCWKKPIKNEIVSVLLAGQLFRCMIKKVGKNEIELLKKDPDYTPLYIPKDFVIILADKKEVETQNEVIAIGETLGLNQEETQNLNF